MNTRQRSDSANGPLGEAHGLELISALADGHVDEQGGEHAIQMLLRDNAAIRAWHHYHLIGDALRSADLAAHVVPGRAAFVSTVMRRVAAEPALGLDAALPLRTTPVRSAAPGGPAANDAWGWKLLAGCASVAATVAVAWNFSISPGPPVVQATAPVSPVPVAVADPVAVMIRDPRLDELLAAHRQFGGSPALQTPVGFLRNATFEVPSR